MDTSPPQESPGSASERLDSWKEIAGYLRRSVRTVRRWEQMEGLPVHRHIHERQGSVYALKPELDRWWNNRGAAVTEVEPAAPESPPRVRGAYWLAAMGAVMTLTGIGWYAYSRQSGASEKVRISILTSYLGHELQPSLSPDGSQMAFCWNGESQGNFDIYIKLVGPGAPIRLTSNARTESSPAWSPDGRFIAFLRDAGNGWSDILLIPALGGASERKLADVYYRSDYPFGAQGTYLAWTPDSRWLVFVDRTAQEPFGLSALSLETGERRRLTSVPAPSATDFHPSISPDGRMMVFVRSQTNGVSDLYTLELTPDSKPLAEPRRITFDGRWALSPAWLADGTGIIFSSNRDGFRNLWRIHPNGGKPQRITDLDEVVSPAISRRSQNGLSHLICSRSMIDDNIWRFEAPNSLTRFIASTRRDLDPEYSPDGQRIAFGSDRSGTFEIWISDSSGANARQISFFNGPTPSRPRWSPDGKEIVFALQQSSGIMDIYKMAAEGQLPPHRLTTELANDFAPSWSSDGRFVYFCSNRSGSLQVWRLPSQGGPAIQVTRKGGLASSPSRDGRFLFYTKSDANPTELWKVPVGGGDETPVVAGVSRWANFTVLEDGIYFMSATGRNEPAVLRVLQFRDGAVRTIGSTGRPTYVGFTVSPDRRTILYGQRDQDGSDLMMLENF